VRRLWAGLAFALVLGAAVGDRAEAQTGTTPPAPTGKRFGHWVMGCRGGNDRAHCVLLQSITEALSRTTVFAWLVRYDKDGKLISYFTMPTGVLVNKGVTMKIDDGQPLRVEYERCGPRECRALFAIANDFAKQLASAKQVIATVALDNGNPADVVLSLDGYADGVAALSAVPQ